MTGDNVIRFQPAPPRPRKPRCRPARQSARLSAFIQKAARLEKWHPRGLDVIERLVDKLLLDV